MSRSSPESSTTCLVENNPVHNTWQHRRFNRSLVQRMGLTKVSSLSYFAPISSFVDRRCESVDSCHYFNGTCSYFWHIFPLRWSSFNPSSVPPILLQTVLSPYFQPFLLIPVVSWINLFVCLWCCSWVVREGEERRRKGCALYGLERLVIFRFSSWKSDKPRSSSSRRININSKKEIVNQRSNQQLLCQLMPPDISWCLPDLLVVNHSLRQEREEGRGSLMSPSCHL